MSRTTIGSRSSYELTRHNAQGFSELIPGRSYVQLHVVHAASEGCTVLPKAGLEKEKAVLRNIEEGELASGSEVWRKDFSKNSRQEQDPRPEQRLPRELLKELIEGSVAFRECWRNVLNTAMQMEREEFLAPTLGAERAASNPPTARKAKTLSTRVGPELQIRIRHKYVTWTSIPDPWSEGAARRKP